MSPTYNDHFRQATKKVTKNRRFKCRRISLEVVGGYYYSIIFAMSHSVDWTTMSHVSNVGSNVIDVTQTVTTLCEVTIPKTGVYFVSATVDSNLLANDVGNANVYLSLNGGNAIAGSWLFFNNNGRDWFMGGLHSSAIVSCNKGDKIQFRGQSGLNKWQAGERRRLDAFRIG